MHSIPSFVLFLWSESPFFPGGERGVIDLSVQRDVVTGLPVFRASGIKGVFRSFVELSECTSGSIFCADNADIIFGSTDRASLISFVDAHILLIPVRSPDRFFVFATSLYTLVSLRRLLSFAHCGSSSALVPVLNNFLQNASSLQTRDIALFDGDYLVEAYDTSSNLVKELAEGLANYVVPDNPSYDYIKKKIVDDLIVIPDNAVFRDVVNRALDRVVRIGLDYAKKVVKEGHLFYQELIPENTLLFSLVLFNERDKSVDIKCYMDAFQRLFDNKVLFFGGDESIGKGMLRIVLKKLW